MIYSIGHENQNGGAMNGILKMSYVSNLVSQNLKNNLHNLNVTGCYN